MENWHMESFQREGMLHKLLLIDVDLKLLCPSMWTVSKAHILIYIMATKSRWQAVFVQSPEIQGKANPQIYFSTNNGRFTTLVE
jgi:hypothetical protein